MRGIFTVVSRMPYAPKCWSEMGGVCNMPPLINCFGLLSGYQDLAHGIRRTAALNLLLCSCGY